MHNVAVISRAQKHQHRLRKTHLINHYEKSPHLNGKTFQCDRFVAANSGTPNSGKTVRLRFARHTTSTLTQPIHCHAGPSSGLCRISSQPISAAGFIPVETGLCTTQTSYSAMTGAVQKPSSEVRETQNLRSMICYANVPRSKICDVASPRIQLLRPSAFDPLSINEAVQ